MKFILILTSSVEIILLITVVVLFIRLRSSEAMLTQLKQDQKDLLDKLQFNAQLEKELVSSFNDRQNELSALDQKLRARTQELNRLVKKAEAYSQSPRFLKEIIISGYKNGESVSSLSRSTGLSKDEIDLILEQNAS
jgi:uncharacterized protein YhaN